MSDPIWEAAARLRPRGAALARRILAFAGIPFLSLVAPFIFLPVLARLASVDVWVAIAVGQSLGGLAALVAGLGYTTLAPPTVARAGQARRRRILATSLHARFPLWLVSAAVVAVVAGIVAPDSARVEAATMAVAMSLAALAPTWFWIGSGRARPIVILEVMPRMAATLAATGILLLDGSPLWYPVLLVVAMAVAPLVVYTRYARDEIRVVDRDDVRTVWREHPPALVAEVAGGLYNILAVTIVSAVTPVAAAARFVAGDKAYRIGQYTVSALGNALQGWVVERDEERFVARFRLAVALHVLLGATGLVLMATLGAWATTLIFGDEVAIDGSTATGFGVAFLGVALGTVFGRIGLIAMGARTAYMACVLAASAAGVAGLVVGGLAAGAAGAAWGLGIVEFASGLAQALALAAVWRRRARAGALLDAPEDA